MTRPARLLAFAAAILVPALVGGCGKLGALERPGALAGQPGATPSDAPDPSRAVKTVDPRDAATLPTPRQ